MKSTSSGWDETYTDSAFMRYVNRNDSCAVITDDSLGDRFWLPVGFIKLLVRSDAEAYTFYSHIREVVDLNEYFIKVLRILFVMLLTVSFKRSI